MEEKQISKQEHSISHAQEHEHSHAHNAEHDHEIEHAHNHGHYHKNTKEVVNRLSRAIGHLNKVKSMVENGEDCGEVLIQLAAVKSALNNTGKMILKDHIEHCIVHAIEEGDHKEIEDLNKAIDQFMK